MSHPGQEALSTPIICDRQARLSPAIRRIAGEGLESPHSGHSSNPAALFTNGSSANVEQIHNQRQISWSEQVGSRVGDTCHPLGRDRIAHITAVIR